MGEERVLRIKEIIGLEKKYEAVDVFSSSFFRDNYYNAYRLTEKILARNQIMEDQRKKAGIWNTRQEKLYNIITLCGGRGSGKTSVMDSIVKALQNNLEGYSKFIGDYEKNKGGNSKNDASSLLDRQEFICLEMIDASMLEEKENILDVILSKMYQQLRRKLANFEKNYLWETEQDDFYGKEDIYRLFEDIYQSKRQFQQRMDKLYETGESSLEKLGNLAGSMEIREKMQKLIDMYLKMMCSEHYKRACMVISIDDLDMHKNAYDMLEQLHRYLMIPHVIIYLAVAEREIQSVCKRHFEKSYDSPGNLTTSYLEKVLPYSRRIYLPATFSGDFFNVLTDDGTDPNLYGYPVKRFLLREIARKTWVFYDGCGFEMHFYEIENLRTLINTYYLLESMGEYEAEKMLKSKIDILKKYQKILDLNFEKLRNNVVGRMATEKLDSLEQKDIFYQYYKEDFSSNGEYLVREIAAIMEEDAPNYNYGELMGALYALEKNHQKSKPLIQCVLALGTIELTQNYLYAFLHKDMNSRKKWDEYISGTVLGKWGNQIFPKVKLPNVELPEGKSIEIAYINDCMFKISTELGELDDSGMTGKNPQEDNSDETRWKICERLFVNKEIVESVVLLMSFFAGDVDISLKGSEGKLIVELSAEKCTFDLLGFVINSMSGNTFTDKIILMLQDALKRYVGSDDNAEVGENIWAEHELHKLPIMKEYKNWYDEYKGAVLPIYSLDIMYNVLKRVKKKMGKMFAREIDQNDFLSVLQSFYMFLGDSLTEEDMFYGKRTEENGIIEEVQYTDFYNAYLKNPFMSYFVREKETEKKLKTGQELKMEHKPDAEQVTMKSIVKPGPTEKQPINKLPELFGRLFEELIGSFLKG